MLSSCVPSFIDLACENHLQDPLTHKNFFFFHRAVISFSRLFGISTYFFQYQLVEKFKVNQLHAE